VAWICTVSRSPSTRWKPSPARCGGVGCGSPIANGSVAGCLATSVVEPMGNRWRWRWTAALAGGRSPATATGRAVLSTPSRSPGRRCPTCDHPAHLNSRRLPRRAAHLAGISGDGATVQRRARPSLHATHECRSSRAVTRTRDGLDEHARMMPAPGACCRPCRPSGGKSGCNSPAEPMDGATPAGRARRQEPAQWTPVDGVDVRSRSPKR
jgi:hypothetical protein